MSVPTYPAAEVDQAIADLLDTVSETANVAEAAIKRADAAEAKVAEMESKSKVVLEKVASVTPAILTEALDTLIKHAFITSGERAELATQLEQPDNALRLLSRIAKLSPYDEPQAGRGIPKSASTDTYHESDPDGWLAALEEQTT